MTPASNPEP